MGLDVQVADDADAAARAAADLLEAGILGAVDARGVAVIAVSGGATPWTMLTDLAHRHLPWSQVHVFQVDERAVSEHAPDRNLTQLRRALTAAPLPPDHLHPMPVDEPDAMPPGGLDAAAQAYEALLVERCAGVLDIVHLGLGDDGHTASLAPHDPVVDVTDRLVAPTSDAFRGRRRLTLTLPTLHAARAVVWLVCGGTKQEVLPRLVAGTGDLVANRVARDRAVVVSDRAAAVGLDEPASPR
jgi:6-phosphogluconolactonase